MCFLVPILWFILWLPPIIKCFIVTNSVTVGDFFSPTHKTTSGILPACKCHCGAYRSDACIAVVCHFNLHIFTIELVADTQNILFGYTLRVHPLFWIWKANRSNDIGPASHWQPQSCPYMRKVINVQSCWCFPLGAFAAFNSVQFMLPTTCASLYSASSQASPLLYVWSSDVVWKPIFKKGWVESNMFLPLGSLLWGATQKWPQNKGTPLSRST